MENLQLAIFENQERNERPYSLANAKGEKVDVKLFDLNNILHNMYTTPNTEITDYDQIKDSDQAYRRKIILENIFTNNLANMLRAILGQVAFNINLKAEKLSLPAISVDLFNQIISIIFDSPIGNICYYASNKLNESVNPILIYDTTTFILTLFSGRIMPLYSSLLNFTSKDHVEFYNFVNYSIMSCASELNRQFSILFNDIDALLPKEFCAVFASHLIDDDEK